MAETSDRSKYESFIRESIESAYQAWEAWAEELDGDELENAQTEHAMTTKWLASLPAMPEQEEE